MNWLELLQECSQRMKQEFLKIYGSHEAAIDLGVGAGGDITKKIDSVTEKALIDCLNKNKISCTLVSEEIGIKKIGTKPSKYILITDPVDGSTNAIRGLPFAASVIAVSKGQFLKDIETAIVSDLFNDTIYTAQRNFGSFKNGKKIKSSNSYSLKDAVIGLDFNTFRISDLVEKLGNLFKKAKHFRHFGANALEICYVADGSSDAFIDIRGKLRVTDIAASYLILREAGGVIYTIEGAEINAPLIPTKRLQFIAASNNNMFKSIQTYLKN